MIRKRQRITVENAKKDARIGHRKIPTTAMPEQGMAATKDVTNLVDNVLRFLAVVITGSGEIAHFAFHPDFGRFPLDYQSRDFGLRHIRIAGWMSKAILVGAELNGSPWPGQGLINPFQII